VRLLQAVEGCVKGILNSFSPNQCLDLAPSDAHQGNEFFGNASSLTPVASSVNNLWTRKNNFDLVVVISLIERRSEAIARFQVPVERPYGGRGVRNNALTSAGFFGSL
jgi:hypothetical protein